MALCDSSHQRRATYNETYGLDFDPAVVDIDQIDRAISKATNMARQPQKLARSVRERLADISAETPKRASDNKRASSRASKAKPSKSGDG